MDGSGLRMSRFSRFVNAFFGAVAICLALGLLVGGYLFYEQKRGLDEAQANESLRRAQRLIKELEKGALPPQDASEVEEGKKNLELAEGLLRKGQYGPCAKQVESAMSHLQPVKGEIEAPRESGRVLAAAGGCRVLRGSGAHEEDLQEGGKVKTGDKVETDGDGSLLLSFPNGESLALQPGSALDLAALPGQARESAVKVMLQKGSLVYRTPRVVRKESAGRIEAGGGSLQPQPGSAFQASASGLDGFEVQVFEGEVHVSYGQTSADLRGGLEAQTAVVGKAGIREGAPLMAPPQSATPAEGQIYRIRAGSAKAVQLQWEPSRASAVRVQVACNPLFAKGVFLDTTVSGQTAGTGPLKEGTYYWRLKSDGAEGRSFWGQPTRFGVLGVEGEPKTRPDWVLDVEATSVGDSVLLKGTVKPRVRVTVNDVEVSVDRNGTFLGTFTLPARGPQGRPVTVCAFDEKGNEKTWKKNY